MSKIDITRSDLENLERKIENLSKLVYINGIINSTLDIGKLLTIIMEIIKDIMETEASTLLLYDDDQNNLVFRVALGKSGKELVEKYRVKMGQGIAGWVADKRKGTIVNDVYDDNRFDPDFDKQTGFTTRSIACTPLLYKGRLLGVIQAINPKNRPGFTESDINLFNVFANQAALAVQNAIYFHRAIEEERINVELNSARSVQKSLIPDVDRRFENIHIAARSIAAREISGEFHSLDFHENNIAVALCDIHEKGVPGGLNASLLSGALKAFSFLKGNTPAKIIRFLEKAMKGVISDFKKVSFFYGVIDAGNQNLHFVNSGVAYPILVRRGIARYLKFRSRSLGDNAFEVKQVKLSLEKGDYFVILSDSIVNFKNNKGQILGLKKIMEFIEGDFEGPLHLINSLVEFAGQFMGGIEMREDVSIIAFNIE